MPHDQRPDRRSVAGHMGRYAGLGLQLAMAVGLFLAAGWWVDGKIGTTPLLTIVGALLGAGAGFYSLYYHLVVEPRRRDEP
ncbi:MAG: AtpZ/AtpI family protein [Gemmatimonadetes bacterium]|nr:AtpZ/AtpI family protein [Gemmatimonadota bacterium]